VGRRVVILLAVVAVVAVITFGGTMWYRYLTQVSTDDAYVEGTISPVSAKVGGHVTELLVRDNQAVK
jgi:membrane fusion protein (multidrug efflux system)